MKKFREMNQVRIGALTIAALVVALALLFNLTQFAFVTGAASYRAEFATAAGLQTGDKVRVGGVEVGRVRDMSLGHGVVVVTFDVSGDVQLGSAAFAAIKTATLLGRKYLQLVPKGAGELSEVIPVERTETPYVITDQLGRLATTTERIDSQQLAESLDVLAETFRDAPDELRDALSGVTRLSSTISSRDAEITKLLGNTAAVSEVLADRQEELSSLFSDGNALLGELRKRRAAIRALLINVRQAARQLSAVVKENEDEIAPALKRFHAVLDVLRDNEANIAAAIQRAGPFATSLGEALSHGPFWNAYVQNLVPGNLVPLPAVEDLLLPGERGEGR